MISFVLALGFVFSWAHDNHHGHGCESHLVADGGRDAALAGLKRLENLMAPAGQEAYFAKILAAARAAIEKHDPILKKDHHGHLDQARHRAILKAIADIDSQRLEFSAYKIKRAIEGKHSLDEYINCR